MQIAVETLEEVSLDRFVQEIEVLSAGPVTKNAIADLLLKFRIKDSDLEPFKSWEPDRHTRNLIYRDRMIEVMLICWQIGAVTPLHTHNGQLGWMVVVDGRLKVENFRQVSCNKPENEQVSGMDCIAGATEIEMERIESELVEPWSALNTVDKTQTIHKITNPAEWNQRAVSLHIYSQPIDSCVVFDKATGSCGRREMKYDTGSENIRER